jgi:putative Ca2+/H+ antiporter (TMEM165/GDT1 family)
MNLAIAGTCSGVVFVAELPDKTALASLVLGSRYRALYVFAGVAAAFAVHVVLAVGAGSLLFLLPHRVVEAVVAVLFAAGAVLMLRRRDEDAPPAADSGVGQDREAGSAPATTTRSASGPAIRRLWASSWSPSVPATFGRALATDGRRPPRGQAPLSVALRGRSRLPSVMSVVTQAGQYPSPCMATAA